jgi:hypothetical protein
VQKITPEQLQRIGELEQGRDSTMLKHAMENLRKAEAEGGFFKPETIEHRIAIILASKVSDLALLQNNTYDEFLPRGKETKEANQPIIVEELKRRGINYSEKKEGKPNKTGAIVASALLASGLGSVSVNSLDDITTQNFSNKVPQVAAYQEEKMPDAKNMTPKEASKEIASHADRILREQKKAEKENIR